LENVNPQTDRQNKKEVILVLPGETQIIKKLFQFGVMGAMLFVGITTAFAEEVTVWISRRTDPLTTETYVEMNRNGGRLSEYLTKFPYENKSDKLADFLNSLLERGVEVVFDDEGTIIDENGLIVVPRRNWISVDGINLVEMPGNSSEYFRFAVAALARQSGN
jgi:proteasome assembly chaperone (PAC2) family protein